MTTPNQCRILGDHAYSMALAMPPGMVEMMADAIEKTDNWAKESAKTDVLRLISHPHYRALVSDLIDAWLTNARDLSPQAVALALYTAAAAEKARRDGQTVELVWTGPDTQTAPLRQTEQVILQVIESARERLTLVSYTVYNIPRVCDALVRAADRGVSLRVVIETWDRREGMKIAHRFRAFGDKVASRAAVFLWPLEQRATDDGGNPGVLHVKCVVGDGHWLFLTSANLTENAFTLNMELGVLVSGGHLPSQVEKQFDKLIEMGVITSP